MQPSTVWAVPSVEPCLTRADASPLTQVGMAVDSHRRLCLGHGSVLFWWLTFHTRTSELAKHLPPSIAQRWLHMCLLRWLLYCGLFTNSYFLWENVLDWMINTWIYQSPCYFSSNTSVMSLFNWHYFDSFWVPCDCSLLWSPGRDVCGQETRRYLLFQHFRSHHALYGSEQSSIEGTNEASYGFKCVHWGSISWPSVFSSGPVVRSMILYRI